MDPEIESWRPKIESWVRRGQSDVIRSWVSRFNGQTVIINHSYFEKSSIAHISIEMNLRIKGFDILSNTTEAILELLDQEVPLMFVQNIQDL